MDAKNDKELQKEQKNKEKQDAIEKEVEGHFASKKQNGSSGNSIE